MAKQLINPVERHVEKAVLGLGVLLLIGVIVKYLVASPSQLELGAEVVSPDTIYVALRQTAINARERIIRAPVQEEAPEPLYNEFEKVLNPFQAQGLSLSLPLVVAIGPVVPIVDPPEAAGGQRKLVKPLPIDKPVYAAGRSTYLLEDRDGVELRPAANWVTLSAVFNVEGQTDAQWRQYGATRKEVIFGPVELQRRVRRDDGSWSDDDWVFVNPWPPVDIPDPPTITLMQDEDRIVVSPEDEPLVEQFIEDLSDPLKQLELIRPMMPDIANGTEWTFPVITSYRDVLVQDDYYMFRNEPPAVDPLNRYGKGEETRATPTEEVSAAELSARKLTEAERLLDVAWEYLNENDAWRAWNLAQEVDQSKEAATSDKNRARRIKERAERVAADIKRKRVGEPDARGPSPGADDPDDVVRDPPPIEQLWANDASPGNIQSGKVYQYRMRLNLLNQLVGLPDNLRDPTDATKVYVPGEWTDPVEIAIEASTYYFATSKDPRKNLISIEFFQWFEGVWIKTREKYGLGEPLKTQKIVEVPSWEDPTVAERTTVEFAADAVVVDIDFERAYRERKRGTARTGVRFGQRSKACCAVFADAGGRLQERFVPTDKAHPDKRSVQDRLWRSKTD